MNIDKSLLQESFVNKDYDYFFKEAKKITDFVLIRLFDVYDEELRNDMSQECLENLWKKVLSQKIDPSKDLMSFIWANSSFRIREIFRKENRRNKKAPMMSYDDEDTEWMKIFPGYVYNPEMLFFLNEIKKEIQEKEDFQKIPGTKRKKKNIDAITYDEDVKSIAKNISEYMYICQPTHFLNEEKEEITVDAV